jgi:hypothetical protein
MIHIDVTLEQFLAEFVYSMILFKMADSILYYMENGGEERKIAERLRQRESV